MNNKKITERFVVASNGPNPMTAEEHDAYEAKALKTLLSSLDDDLHDMTDEEVKQELAEAGVDLAESERRWLKLERDALARLRNK